MDNFYKFRKDLKKNIDKDYIELVYKNLHAIFIFFARKFKYYTLIKYHSYNKEKIIEVISQDFSFQKAVGEYFNSIHKIQLEENHFDEYPMILNYCSFIPILLESYPQNLNPSANINKTLNCLLDELILKFAKSINNQIDALCLALKYIESCLVGLNLGKSKIVLLELPLGNSIPLQILRILLDKNNIIHDTISIYLSRNDKTKDGMTRINLIEEKLKEYDFKDYDLLIYIDEWYSGSNFYNICRFLKKTIPGKVNFYPIALMGTTSDKSNGFIRFKTHHDELVKIMGIPEDKRRFIVPQIETHFKLENEDQFFWSEYDRLAGYRKMQLLGSMVSSIKLAAEILKSNDYFLEMTKRITILNASDHINISENTWNDKSEIKKIFSSSFEDFTSILPQIEKIENDSNIGKISDIDDDIEDIVNSILSIVNGRKAKFCVVLSINFLAFYGGINPANRYYFKTHVPVTQKLVGVSCILNKKFIDYIKTTDLVQ